MLDRDFGAALVASGVLTEGELQEALAEQERLSRTASRPPFLWDILIGKGTLSRVQVDEVLASIQNRRRFCSACNAGVLAPRVTPDGEQCGRCGQLVSWRPVRREEAQSRSDDTVTLLDEAPPSVRMAARDPACLLGKYVIVEEAGRGGAGVVYKAWDLVLGQYVALKLIRKDVELDPAHSEEQVRELIGEARNAIRLRHPNIVPVIDAGIIGKEFYICMEYIDGPSLATRLQEARQAGRVSPFYEDPVRYLEILRDVALAVHYAHTFPRPVIHCDLKPGNILLDKGQRPYVADFGLAQPIVVAPGGERKDELVIRGTPAYMAPEQVLGNRERFGPWTDVYALGATLYALLAGRPVFSGTDFHVFFQTVNAPPDPPLQASKGPMADRLARATRLEAACLRCLAKKPEDRYATAREVAMEMDAAIGSLRADSATERLVAMLKLDGAEPCEVSADDVHSVTTDHRAQAAILDAFLMRVIEKVNVVQPRLHRLELQSRALEDVAVLHATKQILIVLRRGHAVEIPWAVLRPQQFVALARDALKLETPEDRLALGLYGLSNGMRSVAQEYLGSLEDSALSEIGRELLAKMA
ncbi:MAG: serine/threonine protein kinase [Planctomycetes bacterium]|nr:serine/threonine protein kinase [Planctomycetota bacterium]